jgi:hypothetical protein
LPITPKASTKKLTYTELLLRDFGTDIHSHLKQRESSVDQRVFLERHEINSVYRAKMADWMVEVLTTFKGSD